MGITIEAGYLKDGRRAGAIRRGAGLMAALLCAVACEGSASVSSAHGDGPDGGKDAPLGSGEGVATVNGTLRGQAFSAHGALGIFTTIDGPGIPPVGVVAIAENFNLECGVLQSTRMSTIFSNQAQVQIILKTGGPPLAPGTYGMLPTNDSGAVSMTATASYLTVDTNCADASAEPTTSGSVTISAVDTATIAGAFALTFSNGDHLTGQFSAPVCTVAPLPDIQPTPTVCVH